MVFLSACSRRVAIRLAVFCAIAMSSYGAAQAGATSALAYRITPKVPLDGEVQYCRDYDGLGLRAFAGHALFVGPTMHVQFTGRTMLSLVTTPHKSAVMAQARTTI